MQKLHQKVQRLVKPTEDNIRLYWISETALSKTLTIGSELPQPPPVSTLSNRSPSGVESFGPNYPQVNLLGVFCCTLPLGMLCFQQGRTPFQDKQRICKVL